MNSALQSPHLKQHLLCTSICVGAGDAVMEKADGISVPMEQVAPVTTDAEDCPRLRVGLRLSILQAGPIPDPPRSPMSTRSPATESFTDIVFFILPVVIGDGHHGNTVMGYCA